MSLNIVFLFSLIGIFLYVIISIYTFDNTLYCMCLYIYYFYNIISLDRYDLIDDDSYYDDDDGNDDLSRYGNDDLPEYNDDDLSIYGIGDLDWELAEEEEDDFDIYIYDDDIYW